MAEYGKDRAASVAYCALKGYDGRDSAEHRFWFRLFLKPAKRKRVA